MLNKVIIMGRLTADPELRKTGGGTSVTTFTLACERDFKTDGEKQTDWPDVVAWSNTAEYLAKYGSKGRMVAINGRLQTRRWTDKDGNKRNAVEIVADNVYFADSKNAAQDGVQFGGFTGVEIADESDMPF